MSWRSLAASLKMALRPPRKKSAPSNDPSSDFTGHVRQLEWQLLRLLDSPVIRFDDRCRSALPEAPGVYRIFNPKIPGETIRAGKTRTAAGGLQQRVYGNHLMGQQPGNLRAQLVAAGVCSDLESAKRYVRDYLAVQVLVVKDAAERSWLEHFMLAALRPRFSD